MSSAVISLHANTFQDYPVYDDRETFYTALTAFMEDGENARFLSDIRYDDNGVIVVSVFGHDLALVSVQISGAESGSMGSRP